MALASLWQVTLLCLLLEALAFTRAYERSLATSILILLPLHLVFAAIWRVLLWPFVFSPLRNLPEPKGAGWLHGHARIIQDKRSGFPQDEWINQIPNDGLIRYRLKYNTELLMITNSRGLAEVLVQKNYDFAKPASLRLGLGRILGVGLIVAEGSEHKTQRRQLMPAFAHRHVKNLYPIFWAKAVELTERLTLAVKEDGEPHESGSRSAFVDLPNWIARTTLDIIGLAGMGQDFHAIENPDNVVCNAYANVFESPPPKSKMAILKMIVEELISKIYPIPRSDNIAIASEELKKVGRLLIQEKQKQRAEHEKSNDRDIISVALESGVFTEDQLVNQILTFLAAGHETTATTIAWAVVALTQHPEAQRKLRNEMNEHLPPLKELARGGLSPEALDNLPYLHAVCNETLRLYPPAGLTKRTAIKDTTIQGQFVPLGTDVIIAMRAINHSCEHWGSDASQFNPERWLGDGNWNSGGAESNFSYMTFLHGPRSCIGQGFAKAEFAILLAVLVKHFKIELGDPKAPIRTETGLTTRPKRLRVRMTSI